MKPDAEFDADLLRLAGGDALMLVNMQNDFMPGGVLAVPDADSLVPQLNRYLLLFNRRRLPVFAVRDWHPADHCSFHTRNGRWPIHCVQHSRGAAFVDRLHLPASTVILSVAQQTWDDVYSPFERGDLCHRLHEAGIQRLFVAGLSLEYCVYYTVRDALDCGFEVQLLVDGVRALDIRPWDGERTLDGLSRLGVGLLELENLSV